MRYQETLARETILLLML